MAASLPRYSPSNGMRLARSLPFCPSVSTRDPPQYFNSLLLEGCASLADMTAPSSADLSRARPPVIIIGAHRSGTTATAHALKLTGLQIGQRLDSHDEPREMQRLHEHYLREVGAAWHDPLPFLAAVQTAGGKRSCRKISGTACDERSVSIRI